MCAQLNALFSCSRSREAKVIAPKICKIVTPLKKEAWQRELNEYPDRALAELYTGTRNRKWIQDRVRCHELSFAEHSCKYDFGC